MVVTSHSEMRAAIAHCQNLTQSFAALYQTAEASIYEIVGSTIELYLAGVRVQILFESKRRDLYLLVNCNVLHIHSQFCLWQKLNFISERVLEFGAKSERIHRPFRTYLFTAST